jgi:flagellar M-ring protein FliF
LSDEAVPGLQGDGKDAAVVNIGSNSAASAPPAAGMAAIAARAANAPAKSATPAKLRELIFRFSSLNLQQRLIVLAAGVLFLVAIIFVSLSNRKDDYRVLFSSINERDGAAIVAALQQMNVPYKFTDPSARVIGVRNTFEIGRTRLTQSG